MTEVVTRFAPSPTGYLHVGGARTAVFNWLWARKNQGRFILRIEDTDQRRNTPTATSQLISDLKWLGITWDEGPEVGGPKGPYLQSQRKEIYARYVQQLLDKGLAYYCLESTEDLARMRQQAQQQAGALIYRRPTTCPSAEQVRQAKAEGRPVAVRFAIPQDRPIVVHDLIRGRIEFDPAQISDFVILKADDLPTYNMACVVDDYLMGVTHVIRGQEHLNNTPCQQLLWQALFGDAPLPIYVHMAVTISQSGGKLSKRERPAALQAALAGMTDLDVASLARIGGIEPQQLEDFIAGKQSLDMPAVEAIAGALGLHLPEINIVDFRRSGYLPEAMVNFLALLGWNPGGNKEIMCIEELIQAFDLKRLTKANSLFDRGKLLAINTEHLKILATKDMPRLVRHLRAYLDEVRSPIRSADDQTLSRLIKICPGARTLADIEKKCRFAFIPTEQLTYDQVAWTKVMVQEGGLQVLPAIRQALEAIPPDQFTASTIEQTLRQIAQQAQVGLGKIAQPIRVAVCGSAVSPSIADTLELLGKPTTLARIDQALARKG
ncbi:MAG: glutamate--tRNA ligase [Sedimentisphaerales bacterium]|nr:glutamate--tRNA ligase [Sedimentisphaerales bacterium]